MSADGHRCEPLFDDAGRLVAYAMVSPDLGEDGRRALLNIVEAAKRLQADEDEADPEAAAERAVRYAAGRERIRMRAEARRVREQGG